MDFPSGYGYYTPFDSRFTKSPLQAQEYNASSLKLPTASTVAQRGQRALSQSYAKPTPGTLSDVETVSWSSETDQFIDLLRYRQPYQRCIPPAHPRQNIHLEIRLVEACMDSSRSSSSAEGSLSESSSRYENSKKCSDSLSCDDSPTNSANTTNNNANDKNAGFHSAGKNGEDNKRNADYFNAILLEDFKDESDINTDDISDKPVATKANDCYSLFSFSYCEPYNQMGLSECLQVGGKLDGLEVEDVKLDLSWVNEENPTPRKSESKGKRDGHIKRFVRRLRKLFICCIVGFEDDSVPVTRANKMVVGKREMWGSDNK